MHPYHLQSFQPPAVSASQVLDFLKPFRSPLGSYYDGNFHILVTNPENLERKLAPIRMMRPITYGTSWVNFTQQILNPNKIADPNIKDGVCPIGQFLNRTLYIIPLMIDSSTVYQLNFFGVRNHARLGFSFNVNEMIDQDDTDIHWVGTPMEFVLWNATIYSMTDGKVVEVRTDLNDQMSISSKQGLHLIAKDKSNYGNYVAIKYTPEITIYYTFMKNRSTNLNVGDSVMAGDIIGRVGCSGISRVPSLAVMIQYTGNNPQVQNGLRLQAKERGPGISVTQGCNLIKLLDIGPTVAALNKDFHLSVNDMFTAQEANQVRYTPITRMNVFNAHLIKAFGQPIHI